MYKISCEESWFKNKYYESLKSFERQFINHSRYGRGPNHIKGWEYIDKKTGWKLIKEHVPTN